MVIFESIFSNLSDHACLSYFRFLKADILLLVSIVINKSERYTRERNYYTCKPLLATCILLSRLATPYSWSNREFMFRKYASQLPEIFWETLDEFVDDYQHLIVAPIHAPFTEERGEYHAKAVQDKSGALDN